MTEAVFPLLGSAFVILVVLPLFALVSKAALLVLERRSGSGAAHGLRLRYLVLTGATGLPVAWLLSAGLHQAETGRSVVACLFDHGTTALCIEAGLFAAALGLLLAACTAASLRTRRGVRPSRSPRSRALARRIEAVLASNANLRSLAGRIVVIEDDHFALGTQGIFRPYVVIGAAFAEQLTDDALAGALGHESEHVRGLDPLRYLILALSLAANPIGRRLLSTHAARWLGAHEAHCDREAVILGASPLSLAEALVRAARPTGASVGLGARDTAVLRLRLGFLLAFAENPPRTCCRRGLAVLPTALGLLLVALLLPHQTSTAALDALHFGAEHAVTYFWR